MRTRRGIVRLQLLPALMVAAGAATFLFLGVRNHTRQPAPSAGAAVPQVIFSPDGQRIATRSGDRQPLVYDARTNRFLRRRGDTNAK
jgi:hypothetical protein